MYPTESPTSPQNDRVISLPSSEHANVKRSIRFAARIFRQAMGQVAFAGVTGDIQIDANGDRVGGFEVVNYRNSSLSAGKWQAVGSWAHGTALAFQENSDIVWPGRTLEAPADRDQVRVLRVGAIGVPPFLDWASGQGMLVDLLDYTGLLVGFEYELVNYWELCKAQPSRYTRSYTGLVEAVGRGDLDMAVSQHEQLFLLRPYLTLHLVFAAL